MSVSRFVCAAALTAVLETAAFAGKGLGPLYNVKYESLGIYGTYSTPDNSVTVTEEEIQTVNCGGCQTAWLGPGFIFHLKNNTKKPICVHFSFTMDTSDWQRHTWGDSGTYYLKGGKTLQKLAGYFWVNGGDLGEVDGAYHYKLRSAAPNPDKSCPRLDG